MDLPQLESEETSQKGRTPKGEIQNLQKKLTTKSLGDPEVHIGWEDYKKLSKI